MAGVSRCAQTSWKEAMSAAAGRDGSSMPTRRVAMILMNVETSLAEAVSRSVRTTLEHSTAAVHRALLCALMTQPSANLCVTPPAKTTESAWRQIHVIVPLVIRGRAAQQCAPHLVLTAGHACGPTPASALLAGPVLAAKQLCVSCRVQMEVGASLRKPASAPRTTRGSSASRRFVHLRARMEESAST